MTLVATKIHSTGEASGAMAKPSEPLTNIYVSLQSLYPCIGYEVF
jgi:hypothetical protein